MSLHEILLFITYRSSQSSDEPVQSSQNLCSSIHTDKGDMWMKAQAKLKTQKIYSVATHASLNIV